MILLDTNVVSEAMKPEPAASVRQWLDAQAAETLYLSTVTIAELLFGVGALQEGKRKARLTAAVEGVIGLFADRILPFDAGRCAPLCGSGGEGPLTPEGAFPHRTAISPPQRRRAVSPSLPATRALSPQSA